MGSPKDRIWTAPYGASARSDHTFTTVEPIPLTMQSVCGGKLYGREMHTSTNRNRPRSPHRISAVVRWSGNTNTWPDSPNHPERPLVSWGHTRSSHPEEEDAWQAGRDLFDRDVFLEEGLGPVFNGDNCRACHFDPVPGGAGPLGVNNVSWASK